VEYQLAAIERKYNLSVDEERVQFVHEAAEFISTLPSAVQREIYGHRAADRGKISYDAMKLEVDKAYKKRVNREKKAQEKKNLAPAQNAQPKTREFRYDNVKAAMAEEAVLTMVLKEPALFEKANMLTGAMFSSAVLGRAFDQLQNRYRMGQEVSAAVLTDFTPQEMAHLAGLSQKDIGPVNEQALQDCVGCIVASCHKSQVQSDDDLRAMQKRLQERKGMHT
jgi:DNA primase